MAVRTAGSPNLWESVLDDLPLEPGEELWLVSDLAEVKGLGVPHAIVVTDRRLLAISRPPMLSPLIAVPRESLAIGPVTRREVQLNVSGVVRHGRTLRLQWIDGPDDATYAALHGMISAEKPSFVRGSRDFTLPTSYIGGHGCPVPRQTRGALVFAQEQVRFLEEGPWSCLWEVAVHDLTMVEFGGPGKWRKGGRFFGGGFGIVGAAEGMAIAAVLNSLTTRTGVTTIVHLEAGADMSTWWLHADWHTPEQLQIELSWLVSAVRNRTSVPAEGRRDFVERLAQLAELHGAGALTDEEFAAAKARLLGDKPA